MGRTQCDCLENEAIVSYSRSFFEKSRTTTNLPNNIPLDFYLRVLGFTKIADSRKILLR